MIRRTRVFRAGLPALAPSRKPENVTEIKEVPNRGHALTIDSSWREVADTALAFVKRFV
jgi:hypothetical protein